MAYRLRRLLVVNIGLPNGHTTARIAELDPRGGAALTGRNGVGKTTLLRLVPLFYGLSPSRIIVRGDGQEDLVRFVLPTHSSAIAFEYEREDESALRLAVVARSASGDAPEYRIYRCGFDRAMFVDESGNFRTRDDMEAWARARNVPDSGRLDTIDYRRVILHLHSEGRDATRLARLARDYSLGPGPLPNLDRIVGAVTREKVSFEDLQAAVVSVIEGDQRSAHQKVLRERRRDVERWLSDRDACEAALKLEKDGQTTEMAEQIASFRGADEELRLVKWRVVRSRDARTGELKDAEAKRAADTEAAAADRRAREGRETELRATAGTAQEQFDLAEQSLRAFQKREQYMIDEDAVGWAARAAREPELQRIRADKQGELEAIQRRAAGAVEPFEAQRNEAKEQRRRALASVEQRRTGAHSAHAATLETLREQERAEREASETRFDGQIDKARGEREAAVGEAAAHHALAVNAGPTPEEQAHQDDLLNAVSQAQSDAIAAQATAEGLESELRRATRSFDDAQGALAAAREALRKSEVELARARDLAEPAEGTVLAALRAAGSNRWKTMTARVLDPALLNRTDLAPEFSEDGEPAAYGLSVDLAAIDVPLWTDDEELRAAVRRADAVREGARGAVERAEAALHQCAESRASAERAAAEKRAEADVKQRAAKQATETHSAYRLTSKHAVETRRTELHQKATDAKRRADLQGREIARLESERKAAVAKVEAAFSRRRAEAENERGAALRAFDEEAKAAEASFEDRLRRIDDEEAGVLRAQGLDPMTVKALRDAIKELDKDLVEISKHAALVTDWTEWRRTEEPRREGLQQAHDAAKAARETAHMALESHREEAITAGARWKARCGANEQEVDRLVAEISSLTALLDSELADVPDRATECEPAPADILKGRIAELKQQRRNAVNQLRACITRFSEVMRGREGKIKDAIEADLGTVMAIHGDERVVQEASFYVRWFDLSRRQTIESVAAELKGIMDAAGSFYNQFRRFENEVSNFNGKLQKALDRCSRPGQFDRFSDLHIEIVCSLRNLGFMDGLRQLSEKRLDPAIRVMDTLPGKDIAEMLKVYVDIFGQDGTLQVDLADHVRLQGTVTENGRLRHFSSEKQLANVSSTGITSLIVMTTMLGFIDMIRHDAPVHVAVATDEVGRFDGPNLKAMLHMLASNRIDVMTASPDLTASKLRLFPKNYIMENDGLIREPRVVGGPTAEMGKEVAHG